MLVGVCIYVGWHESGPLAGTSAAMLVDVCIYVCWHESGTLAGTSTAMLVGTSAPETYSKFGLHLHRLT